METHQNKDIVPSYSPITTQDTLLTVSEQLFKLQEQLLQLRLNVAGETQSASSTQTTDKPMNSEHTVMSRNDIPVLTSASEAKKLEAVESTLVNSIRFRIDHVKKALQNTIGDGFGLKKPKDESPFADDVLLAWHRTFNKSEYAEALCKQLEQLRKEEAEQIRHMYWLVKDQQRQLVIGLQKQEQDKDKDKDRDEANIRARLEHIVRTLLEQTASIKSVDNAVKALSMSTSPLQRSATGIIRSVPYSALPSQRKLHLESEGASDSDRQFDDYFDN